MSQNTGPVNTVHFPVHIKTGVLFIAEIALKTIYNKANKPLSLVLIGAVTEQVLTMKPFGSGSNLKSILFSAKTLLRKKKRIDGMNEQFLASTLNNTLSLLASRISPTVHLRVNSHGFVLTLLPREALSDQPC